MATTETRLRKITVNGASILSGAATLADLVVDQGMAGARVATAVNGEFVAATRRAEIRLSDGDRIEIVHFIGGG